ncbi:hypothetical protein [Streptomyces sp. NPDC002533]
MRIRMATAATMAACTVALTVNATAVEARPGEAQKPTCGSVESFRLGGPYNGRVTSSGGNASINDMAFGPEAHRQGRVSDGAVTGTATVDYTSKRMPLTTSWTAMDEVMLSPMAHYLIRTSDGQSVGSVTCNESGAVTEFTAKDMTFFVAGGTWKEECLTGVGCGYTKDPERVESVVNATLTMKSEKSMQN